MDKQAVAQYLERIRYDGGLELTIDTLNALQFQHLLYIPYENLDIHMSRPIEVEDLQTIKEKVLDRKRGGYCVELNQLFFHLLQALGFQAEVLFSRGTKGLQPGQLRVQSHIMILVTIGSARYIADVGASTFGTPLPISIDHEEAQEMNGEEHRMLNIGVREYSHQQRVEDGSWCDIKCFHVENRAVGVDYELINFFSCNHRNSRHPGNAILTIQTIGGIKTLQNDEYGVRIGNSRSIKRTIGSPEEYLAVLEKEFLMPLKDLSNLKVPHTSWDVIG